MIQPDVAVTPPLPVAVTDGAEFTITTKVGLTVGDIGETLAVVARYPNGRYYQLDWEFDTQTQKLNIVVDGDTIANCPAWSGSKKTLTFTMYEPVNGIEIVDVLVRSEMPEVKMYPEVLTKETEYGLLLFKDSIKGQAIKDGALEFFDQYSQYDEDHETWEYADLIERSNGYQMVIKRDESILATSANENISLDRMYDHLELLVSSFATWPGEISQPERLMWIEGYILSDITSNQDKVKCLVTSLESETSFEFFASQDGKQAIAATNNRDGTLGLSFNGQLSKETKFDKVEEVENPIKIFIRTYNGEPVILFGYAFRLNEIGHRSIYKKQDGYWVLVTEFGVDSPIGLYET